MTTLNWNGDATHDGRFAIQTEHVWGEGVCYSLMLRQYADLATVRRLDIETAFYGRGGRAKVRAAAAAIAAADQPPAFQR